MFQISYPVWPLLEIILAERIHVRAKCGLLQQVQFLIAMSMTFCVNADFDFLCEWFSIEETRFSNLSCSFLNPNY